MVVCKSLKQMVPEFAEQEQQEIFIRNYYLYYKTEVRLFV